MLRLSGWGRRRLYINNYTLASSNYTLKLICGPVDIETVTPALSPPPPITCWIADHHLHHPHLCSRLYALNPVPGILVALLSAVPSRYSTIRCAASRVCGTDSIAAHTARAVSCTPASCGPIQSDRRLRTTRFAIAPGRSASLNPPDCDRRTMVGVAWCSFITAS